MSCRREQCKAKQTYVERNEWAFNECMEKAVHDQKENVGYGILEDREEVEKEKDDD